MEVLKQRASFINTQWVSDNINLNLYWSIFTRNMLEALTCKWKFYINRNFQEIAIIEGYTNASLTGSMEEVLTQGESSI